MGGKSSPKTQTVTNTTTLPPQFQSAINSMLQQSQGLQRQFGGQNLTPDLSDVTMEGIEALRQGPDAGAVDQLRRYAMGQGPTNPFTSPIALNGMNQFAGAQNQSASMQNPFMDMRNQFAGMQNTQGLGQSQSASMQNPFASGQNSFSDVEDAIRSSATRAVSDRFSQAGRGGSPAESSVLAREVAQAVAPFAYGARENELQRGFAGAESRLGRMTGAEESALGRQFASGENLASRMTGAEESAIGRMFAGGENRLGRMTGAEESMLDRQFAGGESDLARQFGAQMQGQSLGANSFENQQARQMQALGPLLGLNQSQAQNLLAGGGILDQFNQQRTMDPFNLFNLTNDPIIRAMGGAGGTSTTSQPLYRNQAAGILGGAGAGAGIASALGASGPWGWGLAGIGGLLGAF
jgi:hypothetical protein